MRLLNTIDATYLSIVLTHTKHFRPIPVVDSVRAKTSARKRKRDSELLNPILTAVYPFLSAGLEWARPYDLTCVRSTCMGPISLWRVPRTNFSVIAPQSPFSDKLNRDIGKTPSRNSCIGKKEPV